MYPTYIDESVTFLENNLDHFNILLVTATPLEKIELHKYLAPIDRRNGIITVAYKHQTYFLAKYGKYNIVHVSCGDMGAVGRESVLVTTMDAIEACKPKMVMMIGIAFGVNKAKQKIGDLLVSEHIIPYEPQRIGSVTQDRGKIGAAGKKLLNRIRNAMDWHFEINSRQVALNIGEILSGEKLVDDELFRNALIERYPLAKGGEMEGAGFYAACDGRVEEWILIKGICDFADGKKKIKKDHNQTLAIGSVLNFCRYLFEKEFSLEALGIYTAANQKKKIKNNIGHTVNNSSPNIQKPFAANLKDKKKLKGEIVRKGKANFNPQATLDKKTLESDNIDSVFSGFQNLLEQLIGQTNNITLQVKSEEIRKWLKNKNLRTERKVQFCDVFKKLAHESTLVKSLFEQKIKANSFSVFQMVAAAIFEMTHAEPEILPKYLMQQLGIEDANSGFLAKFLYNFRKAIAAQSGFTVVISFIDDIFEADAMKGLTHRIASELDLQHRINANLLFEINQRALTKKTADALEKYLNHLRAHQLKYSVLPLSKTSSQDRSGAPLKNIFVPVGIRDSTRNKKSDDAKINIEKEEDNSKIGTAIIQYKKIVLLGPPGIGKTTVLRHLALAFAEGRSNDIPGWDADVGAIPVFLKLRSFSAYLKGEEGAKFSEACSGSLIAYLNHYYCEGERVTLTPNFFDTLLENGDCIVFVDGLDEVPVNFRMEVTKHLAEFIKRYEIVEVQTSKNALEDHKVEVRSNFFVLSSRPKGFETIELYFTNITLSVRDLKPLNSSSIRELVSKITKYIEPDTEIQRSDYLGICEAIFKSGNLTVLAGTPLFCTSLVMMYKYRGAELPQRRVDVYEEIINLLLGFWKAQDDKARKINDEDDVTGMIYTDLKSAVVIKKERLGYIALQMQKEKKWPEIDLDSLIDFLVDYFIKKEGSTAAQAKTYSERFLQDSHERSGLLVEAESSAPPIYNFTHEGFREFLVADALINLLDVDFLKTVLEHIDEPAWEEPIVLAGSHSELGRARREYVLDECVRASKECRTLNNWEGWSRRLVIAGRMARDMRESLSNIYRHKLKDTLAAAIIDLESDLQYRLDIAFVLDELGWLSENFYSCIAVSQQNERCFQIGKNLVSNQQYQRFVNSPDYLDPMLWQQLHCQSYSGKSISMDELAMRWLKDNTGDDRLPKSWNDGTFGVAHPGVPIVGISWFEATAYCNWILKHWDAIEESKANPHIKPQKIRLPTEKEWDAAMCNTINWTGNSQFDHLGTAISNLTAYANVGRFLNRTSPIGMFSQGVSFPNGLVDAIGNVWEWQASYFDYSQRGIALRGGAYNTAVDDLLPGFRAWSFPISRENDIGFRILIETE